MLADPPTPDPHVRLPLGGSLVVLGYFCLSLVVTYPLVLHFTEAGLGALYYDRAMNVWNGWWVKTALLDLHTNPFHTDLLLYPQGADLYLHTLNLPSALVTLGPQLWWGPIAGYNAGALFALTLAGVAGYRLVAYSSGSRGAGLVGGIIIGFNPLALAMLEGQINVVCLGWMVLCIEFYLRAWAGERRAALWCGAFFILAVLTVGYYEVLLAVFFLVHGLWRLATDRGATAQARLVSVIRQGAGVAVGAGSVALLGLTPYLLGVWHSLQTGQLVLWSPDLDPHKTLVNSADLWSFLLPGRDHWLWGAALPRGGALNADIHDYTYLGLVPLALAYWGIRRGRAAQAGLWLGLAGIGALLALGPVLQVNHQATIPLPFALLQGLPGIGLVRAPERFAYLTYVALGVLAGGGVAALLAARPRPGRWPIVTGLAALLLLELPLHVQPLDPMPVPAGVAALGAEPGGGAVLELPLTQHGRIDAPRMAYQTVGRHAITSAYLARSVVDPYTAACSPFNLFRNVPAASHAADIISPTVADALGPGLLRAQGVGFITVYKQGLINSPQFVPLDPRELGAWQTLAGRLGTPLGDDSLATVYRVRADGPAPGLMLQLGPAWHGLEQSNGLPFRWLDGAAGDFCVFSPQAHSAPLLARVTSFASPRHLQIWIAGRMVAETLVPGDGALHTVQTDPVLWPNGPQGVRLVVPEGSARPADTGGGADRRELSVGFGEIRLEASPEP